MSRTVVDINQATILLGRNTVKAVHAKAMSRVGSQENSGISLEQFWDNASDIANTMEDIGKNIKTKLLKEHLRTVGLFHDFGIPAFANQYPNYIHTLVAMDRSSHLTNTEIENEQYNSNHAVMGYYIACTLNILKDICEIILHHHDVNFLPSQHDKHIQLTLACLKSAENMVEKAKRFKDTNEWPHIMEDVRDTLGFDIRDYQNFEDDVCEMMN